MKRSGLRLRAFAIAQRWSRLVPPRTRRFVRGLFGTLPFDAEGALVDGWSSTLVGSSASLVWPTDGDASVRSEAQGDSVSKAQGQGHSPVPSATSAIRCLLVTPSLDVGGLDLMVAFLGRRLPAYGFEVKVLVTPESAIANPGRLAAVLAAEGVESRDLDQRSARAWMSEWKPDIVYLHGGADWVIDESERLDIPVVEVHHGAHLLFNADAEGLAARRRRLAGLVAVSEIVRSQYLSSDPGCDPDFVTAIPNGLETRRMPQVDRSAARRALGLTDERILVSLARHSLQKNTYGLASAFSAAAATDPRLHLLICGRPDDRDYATQVVGLKARMRHGDRLHLRDHTPHVAYILAAADGFVLDAFFEGGPLVTMEAMAAGLRVVVSDVGAAREQIGDDPARGRVVSNPLGDPLQADWESMARARFTRQQNFDELVGAMCELAAEAPTAQERLSLRRESIRRFDDEVCAQRHAQVLRRAVESRGRGERNG